MSFANVTTLPAAVAEGLAAGTLAPYLGPGLLALCAGSTPPADPLALAGVLSSKSSVPGKIKNRVTAVAQFIENFKHRKTLVALMTEAYAAQPAPSALHQWLAGLPVPVIVDTWYDDTVRIALTAARGAAGWSEVQGLSQSEHFGTWVGWYAADGSASPDELAAPTVLYKPWGGHAPAGNFLISDTDFVEVLTEIDIQTPIPALVQSRRAALGFVFLGCRFNDQLPRAFARQIMKRSGGPHYAVMADEPTRMEARFLEEQGITRIAMSLADVAAQLVASPVAQAA
ncbi:SIR2 family NAD-dependent protein deacylase [Aquabacterium sp. OR-4]|uniref:SIR2 family NAD-dependent protein deacylase n=1 Tax=Aquabacterium sp. OR-4 TaxID=2978127 RepID=UPI0021B32403|nr:SIR2 family protein [Aquabacterium sp. OR-4]MDT7838744.1 SIR2 family protein [Aquabacterium sp. OR-4]